MAKKTRVPKIEWRDNLQTVLIKAGMAGMTQKELSFKFATVAAAAEVTAELEALWTENKVQKFSVPTKGKDATHWRATTLMLE